jgi:hypothetical protein
MKILLVELSCSMRTDGRTDRQRDMTKLIVLFRNFVNATKTYVIGVFSSGIFFIPGFIIIDQLVQKLKLMNKRITYIETTWRSEFHVSKAGKIINEDAVSRCPLTLGLFVILCIPRIGNCRASFCDCCVCRRCRRLRCAVC